MSVKRKGGRREMHRVRIVSEGTPPTTRAYVNGFLVSGVRGIQWSLDASGTWPYVNLILSDVEVDLIGTLEEGGTVVVEHRYPDPTERERLVHELATDPRCTAAESGEHRCVLFTGHPEAHLSLKDGGFITRWSER